MGVYVCHFLGQMLGYAYTTCSYGQIEISCIYHTLPAQSYLVLYSVGKNLLHSLIMWLIFLFLSPHSLHLIFCCVLSIVALIWLVLIVCFFCAAIRRNSFSLLKLPVLSHVQVFSCEMLSYSRLKRPQICFSSHFCFLSIVVLLSIVLSVSFLMAVINPTSCFSM